LRFALETGECLRVGGDFRRQELESDEAMKPVVFGLIDNAHSAAA
jgi:hypothetical protein